jgi:glycine cleavage system H lipoate-binding protein
MKKEIKNKSRSNLGYGSSYRKGSRKELKEGSEIRAVIGGQVWMVKPDRKIGANNPCIWMQSGAVEFKNCNNFYDCTTCKYDLGMKKRVESGKQISWQDSMRRQSSLNRVCRHTLTNRIAKRACAYDYQCASCDFDQFFEEVWSSKTGNIPREVQEIKGFDIPMDYYFHKGHTWAKIESGGYIRIGIDDFALKVLGEADVLDLPLVGKELDHNKVGWGLRREGNPADILSPVDGIITEVNSEARENPGLANSMPYDKGWLFMVRTPDIKGSTKKLMADKESLEWMNGEIGKLEAMIEDVAGPLAADGGYLTTDIYGNLPKLGWKNLTRNFLKT